MRRTVVIGLLGVTKDRAQRAKNRWDMWRPTISIGQQDDLEVDRFELLHQAKFNQIAETVTEDLALASPESEVNRHPIEFDDPWDFESVYTALYNFARSYDFVPEKEDYLVHITTGTHVAQICLFLLTESRHLPARLLQTMPPKRQQGSPGTYAIIDLDLSRYDLLATRFAEEQTEARDLLKSGIKTRNRAFNHQVGQIEKVAVSSRSPILLMGPTGAGKSQLARRIFDLKLQRHLTKGEFVEINCATLRGEAAMSALFGHKKGAFTGATSDRAGLLKRADGGLLFLDEIGELGLDEQAMLLRAVEEKCFLPFGADTETTSDFQLIAGTNRDLHMEVATGAFREDLLSRLDLWSFHLPGLAERPEDIEPNVGHELDRYANECGRRVRFNQEARTLYLNFATSKVAAWSGNFRDLNASITRLATLADTGRIDTDLVKEEVDRLTSTWDRKAGKGESGATQSLRELLGHGAIDQIDRFDLIQLTEVVKVCRESPTLSAAGRELFANSRKKRKTANDADRLRKYLARFDLTWQMVSG